MLFRVRITFRESLGPLIQSASHDERKLGAMFEQKITQLSEFFSMTLHEFPGRVVFSISRPDVSRENCGRLPSFCSLKETFSVGGVGRIVTKVHGFRSEFPDLSHGAGV